MDQEAESRSKREELITEAKNFFDFYKKEIGESIRKGNKVIYLNFMKLAEFSKSLSDNKSSSLGSSQEIPIFGSL